MKVRVRLGLVLRDEAAVRRRGARGDPAAADHTVRLRAHLVRRGRVRVRARIRVGARVRAGVRVRVRVRAQSSPGASTCQ